MSTLTNKLPFLKKIAYPYCTVVLFTFALTAVILHKNKELFYHPYYIIAFDSMGYYQYMQWFWLEDSPPVQEAAQEFNPHFTVKSQNRAGEEIFVNKYSVGVALLQSPFFIMGHWIAKAGGWYVNGWSTPYIWCTTFGSLLYAFLALLFLARFLLQHYEDPVVAVVLAAVVGATNWWYYIFHQPYMSHNYTCFLFALTLYYSQQWYKTGAWKHYIPLAIGVGLIAAVRIPNLVYGLVLAFGGVYNKESLQKRLLFLWEQWEQMLVGAFIVVAVLYPQLWYWKTVTGYAWFNAYAANEEHFYWLQPMIAEVLIGYRKGWFVYTPVMLLAVWGFINLYQQKKAFFPSILLYLVLNIYIVSCWGWWWYGGSFGMRALMECCIPLALPLAALLEWARKKTWTKAFFYGAIVWFIFLNQLQTHQHDLGILHYQSMTREAYWHAFLKFPPYSEEFHAEMDSLLYHPNMHLESHREEYVSTIW